MRAFALLLLLAGCAEWHTDLPGYRVQTILVAQPDDLRARCGLPDDGRTLYGCTIRLRETRTAIVFVRPGLTDAQWACVLEHEARHAAGQGHDTRNRLDCEG
jgi:hypothetical protein